jgi:hypothetical protein
MRRAAHAPAIPRRVSGPSRPPLRLAAGGASLVLRVADAAVEVSGSRTMDRLVRSRAWVVIVGFGLIGIVAMQVSMLKLNSGIGRAVETAATLERGNATLRAEVSRLSSGDRIQALAGSRGFLMPEPSDVTFLRAGALGADGSRAARRMAAPDRETAGPAGSTTVADSAKAITATTATGATGTTGAAATTSTTAAPADAQATGTTTPAGGTTPPGTTAPASTAPQQAAAPPATVAPAAATTSVPTVTSSGGVTIP